MASTTASRKAKGRRLQQLVRDLILKTFPALDDSHVRSCSMGAQGEDVQLSSTAREYFNYSTECKCQERVNLHASWAQAVENSKEGVEPLLVVKKNHTEPLAVIRLEHLFELLRRKDEQN